jgi:hypothetical protein
MWLAVWIVCTAGIASLIPRHLPIDKLNVLAKQFLAAGYKILIGFLRNAKQIQINSDEI